MTPEQLRHCASEPRNYRVVSSALNAAADEIERLKLALKPFAEFDTEDFPDGMRAFDDVPSPTMADFRTARAAYQQNVGSKE